MNNHENKPIPATQAVLVIPDESAPAQAGALQTQWACFVYLPFSSEPVCAMPYAVFLLPGIAYCKLLIVK